MIFFSSENWQKQRLRALCLNWRRKNWFQLLKRRTYYKICLKYMRIRR